MTNKSKLITIFVGLLVCLVTAGAIWSSYSISKKTADNLVGSSAKYFEFSKARIVLDPKHKNSLVWFFQYSNPTIIDANFEIYTSLFGELRFTNPTNLHDRLRANEKKSVHPYAK